MSKKEKNTKLPRIDWNKLKIKFMTGNYQSLRDFARKEGLSYNGNFLRNTKGWADEKGAKRLQIGSKIVENFMEEEVKKLLKLNDKIQQISNLALDATQEFFSNKDYCRHTFQLYKYKRDENDNYFLNKIGERIKTHSVQVVETPFVRIDKVRHAIETLNKITRTLKNLGLSLNFTTNSTVFGADLGK